MEYLNGVQTRYHGIKLTRLRKNSLEGKCKTLVIATISLSCAFIRESVSKFVMNVIANTPTATSYQGGQLVEHWYKMKYRLQYLQLTNEVLETKNFETIIVDDNDSSMNTYVGETIEKAIHYVKSYPLETKKFETIIDDDKDSSMYTYVGETMEKVIHYMKSSPSDSYNTGSNCTMVNESTLTTEVEGSGSDIDPVDIDALVISACTLIVGVENVSTDSDVLKIYSHNGKDIQV